MFSGSKIIVILADTLFCSAIGLSCATITAQVCHPTDIGVLIVSTDHVHDFAYIFLRMLVFKLAGETFVSLIEEGIAHPILVIWREGLRPWQSPRIRRIELSSVFVLAKVHAKRELVLSEFTTLDQMVEIVGVTNEINVHVCRRLN